MELSGELLQYLRTGAKILLLILLIPLGAYLREQTYRNVHGNATIRRDLANLWQSLRRWMRGDKNRNNLKNK